MPSVPRRTLSGVAASLVIGLTIPAVGAEPEAAIERAAGQPSKTVTSGSLPWRQFNFERDVVPILSRHGCNSSGCHGKAEGQNGFKLSVFGFDPAADYAALLHESRGRRVELTRPDASLLLTKASGRTPHGGGARIAPQSAAYRVLRDWIAAGARFGLPDDPHVTSITLKPTDQVMQFGDRVALNVVATYSDGQRIDVTGLARYQSNNEGLATVDAAGIVQAGNVPGDVAVMAAFMGQVATFRVLLPHANTDTEIAAPAAQNFIDELVDRKLQRLGIVPSPRCSDADFLRRATIDITGTLPEVGETRRFLADGSDDKRATLVNRLLAQPAYASYWALKWSDLLRVDREQLGHRAAFEYYDWIRESFASNQPWDQTARELLTAEGPLAKAPAGNLYRVVSKPGERASLVSQVLLGVRIECAQCHHHPFDRWGQEDYLGMQSFFVQPKFKTGPRGDLLYTTQSAADAVHPRTKQRIPAFALGQTRPLESPTGDRRRVLADWMTAPQNEWFARNFANRMWAHFLGRGLVEPVDDMRLTNPPSNPELLDALAEHFVASGFDVQELIRVITASRTYQASVATNATNKLDEQNYSRALLRPLQAEVLLDAICQATGVPEKFDGLPAGLRAIELWDSHVPSEFLKTFGRPTRATTCECERVSEPNVAQVLKILNSSRLQDKLTHADGNIARWVRLYPDDQRLVEELYLAFYSRFPTPAEQQYAQDHLQRQSTQRQKVAEDLAWSLMNTTEFLFNH